jgi:hypothetical protein
MEDAREFQSVVAAAEQAAADRDYASAEELLREAASLQEARLGPLHPDLANILNNLGVVYDIRDKPADAERCYRKAYAIAIAALGSDHPFVATSRKNLIDFCQARGRPFELPAPPAPVTAERVPRATTKASRSRAIAVLTGCVVALLLVVVARPWLGSKGSPPPPLSAPAAPAPDAPAPVATSQVASPPAGEHVVPSESLPKEPNPEQPPPTVADAHLCKNISTSEAGDWRCDRVSLPVDPGSLFFYTRVKSAGDTTVQHRWYRGDHLRKVVQLRIRANSTGGYRTYSRNTVDNRNGGDWKVELRSADGALLREEHFVVR